jgi:hypothetical protein
VVYNSQERELRLTHLEIHMATKAFLYIIDHVFASQAVRASKPCERNSSSKLCFN